jgi:hypothetical protein
MSIEDDLRTYASFGPKHAGGEADEACGGWLQHRLETLGYVCERQPIEAETITERDPQLIVGDARAEVVTHCLGAQAGFMSATRPLRVWGAPAIGGPIPAGAIVVAHLPTQRWSSAQHPTVRALIARAFEAGSSALVLITLGPSRELIRLNRPLEAGRQPGPIALMAPGEWARIAPAVDASASATLSLNAQRAQRRAFNLVARRDVGSGRWLVVSTPRSGWGPCAGERGPGIAAFLHLAQWAVDRFPSLNLAFVSTSSHEYENAGGQTFLNDGAPAPDATALWLHLGAGFATRDWHEAGSRLLPLPSADPQRFLVVSDAFVESARAGFAGVAGLEAAYPTSRGGAGEVQEVLEKGYDPVIGMFGAHRFHHTAQDDLRCVDPAHSAEVVSRLRPLLQAMLDDT